MSNNIGPDSFSGEIGKMIGRVVSNRDDKDFQPIACEFFPVLRDEVLCDVNNDHYAHAKFVRQSFMEL